MDIARSILLDREKGTRLLVTEYRDRLYAVALALCRNPAEAEDLAFRTIERAVSRIELYEERDSFYEWLQIILLNLYRNSVRGKMVRSTVAAGVGRDLEDIPGKMQEGDVDSAEKVYSAVDSAILRDAINRLPEDMKEAVILRYFMDMPMKKMAQILSVPVGTVMSRLHYARLALAQRIGAAMKKPAVALIAVAIALLGATAAVVVDGLLGAEAANQEADGDGMVGRVVLNAPDSPDDYQLQTTNYQLSTTNSQLPTSTHQGGTMTRKKAAAAALTAAMAAAPLAAANGDEYKFIVSGEVVAATTGCSSDSSATTALTSGSLADGFVYGDELEARYRTMDESNACSLRSDRAGCIISFR